MALPYLREELERFSRSYRLTPREHDVLFLLVTGFGTVPEIAEHLSLSGNTVHNHFKNIFRRTRTNTKAALLSLFLQQTAERNTISGLFLRRPRVLVIDADPLERDRLCQGLRAHGLDALGEASPSQAAARVADERIDVLVAEAAEGEDRGPRMRDSLRERFGRRPAVLLVEPREGGARSAHPDDLVLRSPVQLDMLCFAILEQLLDSPYERSRLFRVDAELPVKLDDGQAARTSNFGFGGAFLALDGASSNGLSARYAVGSRVQVSVALDEHRALKLDGEVRWRRQSTRPGDVEGVGVRFVDLGTEQRRAVEGFVRRHKLSALERFTSLSFARRA
jgi:DNA-binding NarL/FixJ family response regulator